MELSELVEGWREQLRPFQARMFPRQVLLELHDDSMRGQVLVDDRPQPVSLDVPLPSLTINAGLPLEKESLGDLIGDLLVGDGLIDHFVLAALPPAAVQWRVLVWPFEDWPEDPARNLRQIAPPLNLPFDLEDAYLDLQPLPGDQSQMLLAAAPKPLVDGWIEVFSLAGVQLERLAPAQSCQLAAIASLMAATPAEELVVLVDPDPPGPCRLLLIRGGVPVFERSITSEGSALVNELVRCVEFYRRQDSAVRGLRLLLTRPLAVLPQLESRLSVSAEQLSSDPFGSLVLQGLAIPEFMP